jgi:integrase
MLLNDAILAVKNMNTAQGNDNIPVIHLLRKQIAAQFPMVLKVFRFIDADIDDKKQCKEYYLVKRPHKKHGSLYYVRYTRDGKTIPSMWNTRTNIRELAELFAVNNRERIVEKYTAKTDGRLFTILGSYYEKGSKHFIDDQNINGKLCEKLRSLYFNFIIKRFIPFLKVQKIYTFTDISAAVIAKLQTGLLDEGIKPQTINGYMSSVKRIFKTFLRSGEIKENIFNNVSSLTVFSENVEIRSCHDIEKLNGVFNNEWAEDKRLYLMCLVIYSTGLRNSEIENLKVSDIIKMDDCFFLNVRKSKTRNGVRIVPLHSFLHKKLVERINENGLKDNDFIFKKNKTKKIYSSLYKNANLLLAEKLGLDEAYCNNNHISFYSGRHFWKTLMNGEELGAEIEELFMGHKVSNDVAKRYNHRDKLGKEKLLEKTRKVFAILDNELFNGQAA